MMDYKNWTREALRPKGISPTARMLIVCHIHAALNTACVVLLLWWVLK